MDIFQQMAWRNAISESMRSKPQEQNQEPQEGDLVEITAIGKIERVTLDGWMVRVHGEVVPMLRGQVRLIRKPTEEDKHK
jgi:exosome complex RNA-binding protein Rrp4